jgi:pyruvate kinase
MHPEKLILAQKWMVDRATQEGKPIFVQSQVLESMVKEGAAHRQDAEDVTSGVLEGIDAFILSHETSIGKYPVDATIQLAKCIAEGENILDYEQVYNDVRADAVNNSKKLSPADALATTACSIALDNNVDMFICITETGRIARYIAKYRPFQPILACSTSTPITRQVNMTRGVTGYKIPTHLRNRGDKLLSLILKLAKDQGMCMPGNKVLVFNAENEGKKNENSSFKLLEIESE